MRSNSRKCLHCFLGHLARKAFDMLGVSIRAWHPFPPNHLTSGVAKRLAPVFELKDLQSSTGK